MAENNVSRRRGREQRRASRGNANKVKKFPYIHRNIPVYNLLTDEALEIIENQAEKILEEIGMEFRGNNEVLELWKAAGADVQEECVHIPRGMARSLLKTAPSEFIQYARNPERNIKLGGDAMVFGPVGGPPFVRDLENGRRYATIEDHRNFTKLVHMSPAIHHAGWNTCEPVDVAVNKRHLDIVYNLLRYTDMPFHGAVGTPQRIHDSLEMAKIAFGDNYVEGNPVLLGNFNINSPLVFDETMTTLMVEYAKNNQISLVTPAVLAGAMGPVTSAGCVAQLLAETMAGMAVTQLVRQGAPVIMGGFIGAVAMQSGAPTFGTPESAHTLLAIAQLARRLNIPLRTGGALCASKIPDAQAAYESCQTMMTTVFAGANLVFHSAGWLEGGLCSSYEKFVMDADQLAMYQSMASGMDISETSLAMDAFREVGPGSHFLGCQHTRENYKKVFHESSVADYSAVEQWEQEGSLSADARANKVWKKMLMEYEAPDMDIAIEENLKEFVRKKKEGVPDALE